MCEPICQFIDFYLKSLVESLPSYIRDTTDVLARVDGVLVEPSTLLVTADVESLYTCIDHTVGLDAVRWFLGTSDLDGPLCGLILELVDFILTHNFFVFKDQFYLQKRGTAMGAACAPSYANLFLGAWEREVFGDGGPRGASHVLCWYRYIDDVLFLWDGTVDQLGDFMRTLNDNTKNIHLTYSFDEARLDFLDVRLEVDADRRIQMDVFRKPTSVNSLLHATSAHDYATVRAIPVGQFLRMRRICSTDDRFERQAHDLTNRFLNRGYSRRCIKAGYNRARYTPRSSLLHSAQRGGGNVDDGPVRFISTYNHEWQNMHNILRKHWSILETDPSLGAALGNFPSMTPRRSKNLNDILVRSHYVPTLKNFFGSSGPTTGSFSCGHCISCANVLRCSAFSSSSGTRQFKIKNRISCGTSNVIYYATCPCPKIYVGLTIRELRIRVREHVRDIGAANLASDPADLKTIPRHFRSYHNSDAGMLKVRGIDVLHMGIRGGDNKRILAQMEARWIVELDTMTPKGLNEHLSFASFFIIFVIY
ncbi:uncharacterized protein [Dendrobates tinctorius]|uniref:uncharacterized protein isoform X1 n=1 Tax=Dendrobates tinctorius TaxID=92724 RepID=UPI003CC9B01A